MTPFPPEHHGPELRMSLSDREREGLARAVASVMKAEIKPLEARIAALEARDAAREAELAALREANKSALRYHGVWEISVTYEENAVTTHAGVLWYE